MFNDYITKKNERYTPFNVKMFLEHTHTHLNCLEYLEIFNYYSLIEIM